MTIQFQQLYLKVYKSVLIFTALFTMDWISTSIKNEKSQQRFLILKVNIYTFLYIYCWCKAKYVQSILTLVSFFFSCSFWNMHSKPIQADQEATEVDGRPKCGNDVINNGSYSMCQRARQNTYGSSQGV